MTRNFLTLPFLLLFFSEQLHSQDTANGIIWYPPIQLSDSTHNATQPRIALSGDDTIHVTWWEDHPPGLRLPYTRSLTAGQTFEFVRELLVDSISFPNHAFRPFVVAQGNKVFLFFVYSTSVPPFDTPLRMIISTDDGSNWSDVMAISPDSTGNLTWVTAYSNSLALIYDDPQPEEYKNLLRSANDGQSWTRTNEDLDNYAKIALTSGSLHLVQHTWRPPAVEINYRRSSTLGDSWEIDTVISDVDGYYSDLPTIAGYDNECGTELLAAWRDTKYGWTGCWGQASSADQISPMVINGYRRIL